MFGFKWQLQPRLAGTMAQQTVGPVAWCKELTTASQSGQHKRQTSDYTQTLLISRVAKTRKKDRGKPEHQPQGPNSVSAFDIACERPGRPVPKSRHKHKTLLSTNHSTPPANTPPSTLLLRYVQHLSSDQVHYCMPGTSTHIPSLSTSDYPFSCCQ